MKITDKLKQIDPISLQGKLLKKEDIQLVDVRLQREHDNFNIGGIVIEPDRLFEHVALIERSKPVVFYCSKGIRSQIAIQRLEQKYKFHNLYNLSGGMEAWKRSLDNNL